VYSEGAVSSKLPHKANLAAGAVVTMDLGMGIALRVRDHELRTESVQGEGAVADGHPEDIGAILAGVPFCERKPVAFASRPAVFATAPEGKAAGQYRKMARY